MLNDPLIATYKKYIVLYPCVFISFALLYNLAMHTFLTPYNYLKQDKSLYISLSTLNLYNFLKIHSTPKRSTCSSHFQDFRPTLKFYFFLTSTLYYNVYFLTVFHRFRNFSHKKKPSKPSY